MAEPKRRRRWWRRALIALATLLTASVSLVLGTCWYVADQITDVHHVTEQYPLRVVALSLRNERATVTLSRGTHAGEPGTFRLSWPAGHTTVGAVLARTSTTVTRALAGPSGGLKVGARVGVQANPYTGTPASAVGLAYTTVLVPTPLGPAPAWQVTGRSTTWVIIVHGLGGSRADALPVLADLHALGFPMLIITYRNDLGAPRSPDHLSHLGQTETDDVAAAVRYATAQGASGVVLFGFSLGAAMAIRVAREPEYNTKVKALVLDSPLLDWRATLRYAAGQRGYPNVVTDLTIWMISRRVGLSYAAFDALDHAGQLDVPTLLIQATADTIVPAGLARRLARARPDLVTYLAIPGADHASAIDTDPVEYARALARVLAPYAVPVRA